MELEFFLTLKLGETLPGADAHQKMSSHNRPLGDEIVKHSKDARLSAVLILLYKRDKNWQIVLMKRQSYKGVHSNQVSLPGGKKEESDLDLSYTALRETEEEVGINQNKVRIIGELTQIYIPPSKYLVSPYIGFYDDEPVFIPHPKEVKEIIELPLLMLLDQNIVKTTKMKVSKNFSLQVPYFDIHGHIVWGATAMILSELKELLLEWK